MTFASIPVMRHVPDIESQWRSRVLADAYDPRPIPVGEKAGATIGMAMTESRGSDLRAVQRGDPRRQRMAPDGHKWFCPAPMSDAFFTLARADEGVTCFFVPRSPPRRRATPSASRG
jgi:putative acyl-CoA dehydrogenase